MAELLRGAPVAQALTEALRAESDRLRARGVVPTLAIVRVGARDADLAYERGARKRCEQCGVAVRQIALGADATQSALLAELARLNADRGVHGILLLRPLPDGFDDAAVCAAVAPEKDVDGVTDASMAAIYSGAGDGFAPCTAAACLALLKHYGVPIDGKRAVVVGRSFVIGKPAAMLLLRENATVSVAHTHTENLPALCRAADILLVATGHLGLIGAEHVRAGQTIIDVGIHAAPDGALCGDVRFDEAARVADAITPVPGGVGAVTTAMLCKHVVEAAKKAP
ncbi:MAG: bifunctional 5,10-methylene-tetrahydrofolate dehydrogenase/5,10-methylene-tetrahydrofolate cyclohydrolase [Oscillospiraceae bacterium]|nr:bifunctional 5,10-methylene-tetrahydrofolate dehydrogenase/5,10-methylene-tetrahydrofolate cyclohydrolase [Oscillospiraceae bacterium]